MLYIMVMLGYFVTIIIKKHIEFKFSIVFFIYFFISIAAINDNERQLIEGIHIWSCFFFNLDSDRVKSERILLIIQNCITTI